MTTDPGATVRLAATASGGVRLELDGVQLIWRGGLEAGRRQTMLLPLVRVGAAEDNDVVLRDPGVSRYHAELEVGPEGVRVRDLGSTNGTWLGAVRLEVGAVPDGAVLRLGEVELEVRRNTQQRGGSQLPEGLGELVGGSPAMREAYGLLEAVAGTPVTVLLQGETGTGKELAARTLHELSGRSGPLVVFDAAATTPDLLPSQLFGHERGAFTGADSARPGAARSADGGTLFLDELGELPLDLQPRLLRLLERREVQPLGSDRAVPVDVRVVAATHRNLGEMVEAGEFREDLYFRFRVFPVTLPPLRDRAGDVPVLVAHLLTALGAPGRPTPEAMAQLEACPWPGNVRALRNALERAGVLARGGPILPGHLDLPGALPGGSQAAPEPAGMAEGAIETLAEAEKRMIQEALARTGQQKLAAEELGISVATLRRRMRQYESEER